MRKGYKATFTVEMYGIPITKPDGVVYESMSLDDGGLRYAIRIRAEGVTCDDPFLAGLEERLPGYIEAACCLALNPPKPPTVKKRGRPKEDHTHSDYPDERQKFIRDCMDVMQKMDSPLRKIKLANALKRWGDNPTDSDKLHWLPDELKKYHLTFSSLKLYRKNLDKKG